MIIFAGLGFAASAFAEETISPAALANMFAEASTTVKKANEERKSLSPEERRVKIPDSLVEIYQTTTYADGTDPKSYKRNGIYSKLQRQKICFDKHTFDRCQCNTYISEKIF